MLLLVPTAREARALFDDGRAPRNEDVVEVEIGGAPLRAALCGFGPAAAAALATLALVRERPAQALLLGIGGSYDLARLPVGAVLRATRVSFGDLGVDRGGRFLGPRALGFEQAPPAAGRAAVHDDLTLSEAVLPAAGAVRGGLVTVASASATPLQAAERAGRLSGALLEDMEGFGVALAAARVGVPLAIVRAASNAAGEEDRARWDVPRALSALRAWLLGALTSR